MCFRETVVFGLRHYSMEQEIYHPSFKKKEEKKKSTIPERPSTRYAFASLLLIASQFSPLIPYPVCITCTCVTLTLYLQRDLFELIRTHTVAEVSHHRR